MGGVGLFSVNVAIRILKGEYNKQISTISKKKQHLNDVIKINFEILISLY